MQDTSLDTLLSPIDLSSPGGENESAQPESVLLTATEPDWDPDGRVDNEHSGVHDKQYAPYHVGCPH